MVDFDFKVGMSGRQNLQVLKNNEVVRETGFHHNLILDRCFDAMTNPAITHGAYDFVAVGTGSVPPTNSESTLTNFLKGHVTTSSVRTWTDLGTADGFKSLRLRREWTFAESAVIGNVSETGTGMTNITSSASIVSSTPLFTKALVLSTGGTPTSISVGTGEQLRVVHDTILKIPVARVTSNITVTTGGNTTNHTVEMEAINLTASSWEGAMYRSVNNPSYDLQYMTARSGYSAFNFSANNGTPTGTNITNTNASIVASQDGSIFKAKVVNTYPSTAMNHASGIAGLLIGDFSPSNARFGVKFTPNIPKSNMNKFVFAINIEFARA